MEPLVTDSLMVYQNTSAVFLLNSDPTSASPPAPTSDPTSDLTSDLTSALTTDPTSDRISDLISQSGIGLSQRICVLIIKGFSSDRFSMKGQFT